MVWVLTQCVVLDIPYVRGLWEPKENVQLDTQIWGWNLAGLKKQRENEKGTQATLAFQGSWKRSQRKERTWVVWGPARNQRSKNVSNQLGCFWLKITKNLTQIGLNCQHLLAHVTENTSLWKITPRLGVRNAAYHQHLADILGARQFSSQWTKQQKVPPLGTVHTSESWYLLFSCIKMQMWCPKLGKLSKWKEMKRESFRI